MMQHMFAAQMKRAVGRYTSLASKACVASSNRSKSSSASILDVPLPESIRNSVKNSILDHVEKDTPSHASLDGGKGFYQHAADDALNDLFVDQKARYWPNLPSNVSSASNPFDLAKVELTNLSTSIKEDLVGNDHPVLNQAASYFFSSADGGKKIRPMMVLLLSRALAETMGSPASVDSGSLLLDPLDWQRPDLPELQRRLAEIAEMIHTASLFHDDVIDNADTRRSKPAVHTVFGNKIAILAGDYLLARASVSLARLRNIQVVETMSTVIEHLVKGEVMQMRGSNGKEGENERMLYYLRKNYYKTGSLMANSCKSAALLAGCDEGLIAASYNYGKHLGMAFQLVDDVLDFEGDVSSMGKPALSDLKAGLATAPVLFAAEMFPELESMIQRKFKNDDDVKVARDLVLQGDGIERTKELARVHAEIAMDAALQLTQSHCRDALIVLAHEVVRRTK